MKAYPCLINGELSSFEPHSQTLIMGSRHFRFPIAWAEPERRVYVIFSTSCNLRCPYCFQGREARTLAAIDTERLRCCLSTLQGKIDQIVLFGGEPFLPENKPAIVELLEEYDYLQFVAFTNGNFDEDFIEILDEYAHLFKGVVITLDGPKHIHNKRRVNPCADSYETIICNLKELHSLAVPVDIQVNVDRENEASLEELFSAASNDSVLSQLWFCLNPVKYTKSALGPLRLIERYLELLELYQLKISINNRLVRNFVNLFNGLPLCEHRCSVSDTYVLDFPNQTVYACPQNTSSTIGSIGESSLNIDKSMLSGKFEETSFRAGACADCDLKLFCPFCCPYVQTPPDCKIQVDLMLELVLEHCDVLLKGAPFLSGAVRAPLSSSEGGRRDHQ